MIIQNTFAPHVKNKTLTIPQILQGLQFGVFKYNNLPQQVQAAINQIKPNMELEKGEIEEDGKLD